METANRITDRQIAAKARHHVQKWSVAMTATYRPLRPKLISNAPAGRSDESPRQLANIVTEMQTRKIWPKVFWVRPDSRVAAVDHSAIRRGIKLIFVAGGEPVVITTAEGSRRLPSGC